MLFYPHSFMTWRLVYEWSHTVCNFLNLVSVAQHKASETLPNSAYCLLVWVIIVPYHNAIRTEDHESHDLSTQLMKGFLLVWRWLIRASESYDKYVLSSARNCTTVSQRSCHSLCSYQQGVSPRCITWQCDSVNIENTEAGHGSAHL